MYLQNQECEINSNSAGTCEVCEEEKPCRKEVYQFRELVNLSQINPDIHTFCCKFCCMSFDRLNLLKDHVFSSHNIKQNDEHKLLISLKNSGDHMCNQCKNYFKSSRSLIKHQKMCSGRGGVFCRLCKEKFSEIRQLINHNSSFHKLDEHFFQKITEFSPKKIQSDDKRRKKSEISEFGEIPPLVEYINQTPTAFLEIPKYLQTIVKIELTKLINYQLDISPSTISVCLFSDLFGRTIEDESEQYRTLFANISNEEISSHVQVEDFIRDILDKFWERINSISDTIGSDLRVDFLSNLVVKISRHLPKKAGCFDMKYPYYGMGGVHFVKGTTPNTCLRDSIRVGIFFKK